jgi:orotidine-5'-phosphate decarboxylase
MTEELGIQKPLEQVVVDYAGLAQRAGLDGVVCSPLEAGIIHQHCGAGFCTVTPGVRFADAKKDDQTRITTPAGAKALGSDYIVVGRPITQADDPVAVYQRCVAEFVG